MSVMIRCQVCNKLHETHNFKQCDKCLRTACCWCMSGGVGGPTMCRLCKKGKATPVD